MRELHEAGCGGSLAEGQVMKTEDLAILLEAMPARKMPIESGSEYEITCEG
jgi:hypothetical protein